MIPKTYINGVLCPGATMDEVRHAVLAGERVVAVDDAGVAVELDKNTIGPVSDQKTDHRQSGKLPESR